jgi:hypothetical protein
MRPSEQKRGTKKNFVSIPERSQNHDRGSFILIKVECDQVTGGRYHNLKYFDSVTKRLQKPMRDQSEKRAHAN